MNQAESKLWSKSKISKFITFGTPKFGTSVIMGFADMALLTLYHLAYQLDPIPTTICLGLGKLTVAASQFFLGGLVMPYIHDLGEESLIY